MLVRLSQLAMKTPVGMPSLRALLSRSTSPEMCRKVPVATTTSGASPRTYRSTVGLVGIAASSRAASSSVERARSASVGPISSRARASASRLETGSKSGLRCSGAYTRFFVR